MGFCGGYSPYTAAYNDLEDSIVNVYVLNGVIRGDSTVETIYTTMKSPPFPPSPKVLSTIIKVFNWHQSHITYCESQLAVGTISKKNPSNIDKNPSCKYGKIT